jgi:hypothetical protein
MHFYLVGAVASGLPQIAADSIMELADAMVAELELPARRVVEEYDKTVLTHDVNYEDVASAIDDLRQVWPHRERP